MTTRTSALDRVRSSGSHPTGAQRPLDSIANYEFPVDVCKQLNHLPTPFILYDRARFRRRIRDILDEFDGYLFPAKANPHIDLLREALTLGTGIDVCSTGELDLALAAGATGADINYCSVCMTAELCDRIASLGATVTLNTLDDLKLWLSRTSDRPVSLRVEASSKGTPYGDKFGIAAHEWPEVISLLDQSAGSLAGLHIHTSHEGDGRCFVERLQPLKHALDCIRHLVPSLERINLGGGWPFPYGQVSDESLAATYSMTVRSRLRPHLDSLRFQGRIFVEPGEYVTAPCGYWGGLITGTKQCPDGTTIAYVNTPGVVPSAQLPYPVTLYRHNDTGLAAVTDGARTPTRFVAATNSPFDTIRPTLTMQRPQAGYLAVFGQAGAYLPCLIGYFNGIPTPTEWVVEQVTSTRED